MSFFDALAYAALGMLVFAIIQIALHYFTSKD